MADKDTLGRGNVGIYLVDPITLANFYNDGSVTVAELNSNFVYDITCALYESDTDFSLGDPETSTELRFCSIGNETETRGYNPSIVLVGGHDADRTADTVFNLFRDLALFADVPYIAIQRVGKPNDQPFAIGDRVNLVEIKTDWGVDTLGDNANIRLSQSALPQGNVNWGYKLAA